MWPNPQFPADLVTFTGEILNEKLLLFVQCLSKTKTKKNSFMFDSVLYTFLSFKRCSGILITYFKLVFLIEIKGHSQI